MKVYKFGGASVSNIERIKNVAKILKAEGDEKILIVISAMGKTTNALEKVAEAFFSGRQDDALALFNNIKKSHLDTLINVVPGGCQQASEHLGSFFTEVEWLLHDKPVRDYDYYYDQIVCIGELLSTAVMSTFLNEEGIKNSWLDVRDVLRTDDNFRDAGIDWDFSQQMVIEKLLPLFKDNNLVITQGFIGSTDENESTTLGREGSDYSAAIFANMLDAGTVTIWKDVDAVMSADPRDFPDAKPIHALSYGEVIEMAFYGAQVIHPKTIKPVQNKNIPLYVKSFINPATPGTVISKDPVHHLPPIIVIKQDQVLMELSSKDFSFVGEKPVSRLYEIFSEIKIRPNLTQNAAISLLCCLDNIPEKIEKLALAASEIFAVGVEKELTLLTIRHYNNDILSAMTAGKNIVLEQRTEDTVMVVMRK